MMIFIVLFVVFFFPRNSKSLIGSSFCPGIIRIYSKKMFLVTIIHYFQAPKLFQWLERIAENPVALFGLTLEPKTSQYFFISLLPSTTVMVDTKSIPVSIVVQKWLINKNHVTLTVEHWTLAISLSYSETLP